MHLHHHQHPHHHPHHHHHGPVPSCGHHGDHHQHAARAGHRGFGGRGGRHGAGRDGGGLEGFQRGRKLGSADLQLLLLALLAEQPRHGYELIKALDERSSGWYSPSPGMVYPALTYLEEVGHASVEAQGARKLYHLTEAGLAHIESHRADIDAMLGQLVWFGQRMGELRRAMASDGDPGEGLDLGPRAQPRDTAQPKGRDGTDSPELRAAYRSLKSALIQKSAADPAEQRRMAEVLSRAAAEIRGGPAAAATAAASPADDHTPRAAR